MTTFFFDTETTGFPRRAGWDTYHDPRDISAYENARIVSICWVICNDSGQVLDTKYFIIKPDGFIIDDEGRACAVNGITMEKATSEGVEMSTVLKTLYQDLQNYRPIRMVAHNIEFDYHILLSEIFRLKNPHGYNISNFSPRKNCDPALMDDLYNTFSEIERYCTMENGKKITQIIMANGRIKPPKLIELYHKLFEDAFDAHIALDDTMACVRCYFMIENGIDVERMGRVGM